MEDAAPENRPARPNDQRQAEAETKLPVNRYENGA